MQLKTSKTIKLFHNIFKNKFNFVEYTNRCEPAIFFGIYRKEDIDNIARHNGKKIIWFAGFDATNDGTIKNVLPYINCDTVVVAESDWIARDLDKFNVPYKKISLFMDDIYKWKPCPPGDSLYWYNANNSRYGKKYYDIIRKSIPDLNIIVNDGIVTPRDKMPEIYAKCFAYIRPVDHDGMSQTVSEMALMGRMSIWNQKTPFSMQYEGIEGLIRAINTLRGGFNHKLVSKRAQGYFLTNEALFTDMVIGLCGNSEMDYVNIFNESKERCGSIFRLMKTSLVQSLPKLFGTDQFERPYINEELNKLGLKQLITTKSSGFVVNEWKNIDKKKGYYNNNFNTHDRGTEK